MANGVGSRRADLERVIAWIRDDDRGPHASTRFDNLATAIHAGQAAGGPALASRTRVLASIGNSAHYMQRDWTNLLTLIQKLSWIRERAIAGELPHFAWMHFAASDIDMFHVEIRSCFDHLARVVAGISGHLGKVPDGSWNDLISWQRKQSARGRGLDHALASTVTETQEWFEGLRQVRDDVVHYGRDSIVLGPETGIHFLVEPKPTYLKSIPFLMHNENLVDFSLYSAYHLSLFWCVAESVSLAAFERLRLIQVGLGDGVRSYHGGLDTLRQSIPKLLAV